MKQIVLVLLFIYALQKEIHTDPPKNLPKEQNHYRLSSFRISSDKECPSGYYKHCIVKGMYVGTSKLPYYCYCYIKKVQKINRILKEVITSKDKTIKDKDKPSKDRLIKDKLFPKKRRKIELIEKNSPKCNGDYYVCYEIPERRMSKCICTKNPNLPLFL